MTPTLTTVEHVPARTTTSEALTSRHLPAETNPALVYVASLTSEHSRRTMRRALDRMAAMLTEDPTSADAFDWHALRYQHAQALRSALMATGYKPATVALHLAALRGVLRESWRLGLMTAEDYHRAADVKPPRGSTLPAGRHVDAGELSAMFDAIAADPEPTGAARDAALLAILFGGGLRRAEAVALEIADYDPETGAVHVRHGKGGKERIAYLANGARAAVNDWLRVRPEGDGPLLLPVGKAGAVTCSRLSTTAVADALRRIARRANVRALSPHDARRTFIGELLEAGADLAHVQALAGHASPTTTARYDRRPEEARKRAAERLHVPYRQRKPEGRPDA